MQSYYYEASLFVTIPNMAGLSVSIDVAIVAIITSVL